MNDEQIRIAIAEACDLFRLMPLRRTTRKGAEADNGVVLWYCSEHKGGAATYTQVPDYPNDLNAMHEAEKLLRPDVAGGEWRQWDSYVKILGDRFTGSDDVAHAAAAQRAEAFLRTLNLWKE